MAFHSLELDLSHILLSFLNVHKSITYFESSFVGSLALGTTCSCRFLINTATAVMKLPYVTWIMISAHILFCHLTFKCTNVQLNVWSRHCHIYHWCTSRSHIEIEIDYNIILEHTLISIFRSRAFWPSWSWSPLAQTHSPLFNKARKLV